LFLIVFLLWFNEGANIDGRRARAHIIGLRAAHLKNQTISLRGSGTDEHYSNAEKNLIDMVEMMNDAALDREKNKENVAKERALDRQQDNFIKEAAMGARNISSKDDPFKDLSCSPNITPKKNTKLEKLAEFEDMGASILKSCDAASSQTHHFLTAQQAQWTAEAARSDAHFSLATQKNSLRKKELEIAERRLALDEEKQKEEIKERAATTQLLLALAAKFSN